jgi:circadian clock protein KaiC
MTARPQDSRCSMGIAGLDDILGGGLPSNRFYLVQGNPGVGKTTLALQFLLEGQRVGEKGLYITLSETKEELLSVANSHNWSLDNLALFELSTIEQQFKTESQNTIFHPSELELNQTTQMLLAEIERVKPSRVVFDSLSELRLLTQTQLRYRREMLMLKQFFAGRNCTALLLDDNTSETGDLQVQSIAHGVLSLTKVISDYGTVRNQLEVLKVRGIKFRQGRHDYVLQTGGITVFPRLVSAEHRKEFHKQTFSSGIKEFDALLGGGFDRGTSNIVMGPAGTGKSTIAMKFISEAAKRGERSALFAFDENLGISMSRARQLGINLDDGIKSGMIVAQQIDPAELSPGELSYRIKELVEKQNIRVLVIDSLNGYMNAMPGERYLILQLHELLAYLSNQGVMAIITLAQHGLVGQMQSPVDLTYLGDTIVLLRFFELHGSINKAISVVKKRSGNHESEIRELTTANGRIEVGRPFKDFQGVLTGVPRIVNGDSTPGKGGDHAQH